MESVWLMFKGGVGVLYFSVHYNADMNNSVPIPKCQTLIVGFDQLVEGGGSSDSRLQLEADFFNFVFLDKQHAVV